MKIEIHNILPNPFRNIEKYPINQDRVNKLKSSIKRTEFWGGLVCRESPTDKNKFELAFGHHRLEAWKQLGNTVINIKVLNYSNSQMLQAMADENREIGQHDVKVLISTIEQVKEYLDKRIKECKDYNTSEEFFRGLFENKKSFDTTKGMGVGRETILKFLGKDWTQAEIQFALSSLEKISAGEIDKDALEQFSNPYQAEQFTQAVTRDQKIPKKRQKQIAYKTIKIYNDKNKRGGREIRKIVTDVIKPDKKKNMDEFYKAEKLVDDIKTNARRLLGNMVDLRVLLTNTPGLELKGLKVFSAMNEVQDLVNYINDFNKEHTDNATENETTEQETETENQNIIKIS